MIKNLIFVGPWPPPYGGISCHLEVLLPELEKRGYSIKVFSYYSSINKVIKKEGNLEIHLFRLKVVFIKNLFNIFFKIIKLYKYISIHSIKDLIIGATVAVHIEKNINIDNFLLITHDNDKIYINPFLDSKKILGIYSFIYADFYLYPKRYEPNKKLLKFCLKNITSILSCSKYCAESANRFLESNFKTDVIYNNVDSSKFSPKISGLKVRAKHNIKDDEILLLLMARISKSMGIDFIINIAPKLLNNFPKLVILISGAEYELSSNVVELSKNHDRVKYQFNIDENDKPEYFAACDIFTAPTVATHACMGIANIEAMMSGKPVISSCSGGHIETIDDGISGFLIPFEKGSISEELYINSLRKLYSDKLLRVEMGLRARKRAELLFCNSVITNQYVKLFENHLCNNNY